jgi:endonuclease/exonuclease/phosphatase family metal-dependent hydrolase
MEHLGELTAGRRADGIGLLAGTALLVVVVIEGTLRTLTRLFVMNFDVSGPNATMGLVLALCTGWSLVLLSRANFPPSRVYLLCSGALVAGFLGTLAGSALVAALGAVVVVTAATPPLASLSCGLGSRVVTAVGSGIILDVGIRTTLGTASPYTTAAGTVLLAGVVVLAAGMLAGLAVRDRLPPTRWRDLGATPAPVFILVLVGVGYLAQPWTVARWAGRPFVPALVALVVGVAAGTVLTAVRDGLRRTELAVWAVVYLGSVGLLLYGSNPATVVALASAWTSALVLLGAATGYDTADQSTATTAGVQLLSVLALVFATAATHWAFMPAPLDGLRGRTTEMLFGLHAIFVLAVAIAVRGHPTPAQTGVNRRRRAVFSSALTAAVPTAGLLTTRNEPGADGPRDGSRVRVMAYNLHLFLDGDGQHSLERLRETIAADGADIVAVCESDGLRFTAGHVDGLRWLGSQLGYYTAFGADTRKQSYGVGLLSRWPLTDVSVLELPIERSLTRIAVSARVQTPAGPLPVISTHLSVASEESADAQSRQIQRLREQAADFEQAVVMGDFNITPDDPEYDSLQAAFTDAWVAAEQTEGPGKTYPTDDPRQRIDYVFLQGDWTVRAATTAGTGSDHRAVSADLERNDTV